MPVQQISKQDQAISVTRFAVIMGITISALISNVDAGASEKVSSAAVETNIYDVSQADIKVDRQHPSFVIKLKSNPTTGYSWSLRTNPFFTSNIVLDNHEYKAGNTNLIGAPGYEYWRFHVKEASFNRQSNGKLTFVYVRPWEKNNIVSTVNFAVTIQVHGDTNEMNASNQ